MSSATTESDEDINPFSAFNNTADVYAFMYSEYGADGLRELLAVLLEMKQAMMTMEGLERDALDLHSLGLNAAASIVEEVAKDAPSGEACPFDEAIDPANWRDWNRRHKQDFTGFYLDDGRG